ncbi:CRISPR-associated protein Cas5 [Solibacillus isronensis]
MAYLGLFYFSYDRFYIFLFIFDFQGPTFHFRPVTFYFSRPTFYFPATNF